MKLVTDTGIVFTRELRPLVRDPFTVIFGLIQPLIFLGLFAPLLTGMTGLGMAESLQWFVPGVLVMLSLFGTSTTGANLIQEMQTGSHERQLVTPLARSSLLLGRALKEIAPTVVQALVVIAVTIPFGLRPSAPGVVVGLLVLAVFSVGMGALSYSLALAVKNQDWLFWVVQQTLLFPMLILAGMLLPLEDGPPWLRAAAHVNPLTYVVDAQRVLFAGDLWNRTVLEGAVAAGATAALGLWTGIRAMRRAS
jgi:ABC-2 type transport system permease protein